MTYFLLLPFSITMTLLALVLAPVLPLFADRGSGYLPKWLWWFQTPDNSLYGDEGHQARCGYHDTYLCMVAWLLRNPAYGFEWDGPLAAEITQNMTITVYGNPWIKNRDNPVKGWYFCTVGKYWNFKAVIPFGFGLCFMPEFGWKLQPWAQNRETAGKAMYVFSPRITAYKG